MAEQQRTVADAFNQYHRNYVKPNIDSKLSISTAQSDYAKKADLTNGAIIPKKASQLETARSLQVSLSSGAAQTFDGTADKKNIGVTGILPVANGGTGASSLANITVGAATKASQDGSGNVITSTYAKVSDITGGNITAKNATNAVTATKATGDKNGLDIAANYLKITDAANDYLGRHGTADAATKASQDGNGKVISSTYAVKSDLTDGTITVKNATNATTCTGNAATATKLKTARDIKVNLASTNAGSFDGTASISAGVTGILPVANGGTGVTSKDALMEKLYLAKNITTSNDFKNIVGDRDMDCLVVPGIYEMDSPNASQDAWWNIPTIARCIIEVFRTNEKQVLQRVTRTSQIAEGTLAWRRFGVDVGTENEQWSAWASEVVALNNGGVLNKGINVTQNEEHFVASVTDDRRIDFNNVITPGTYFVNKPNDATIHWENMPWNTQSFSLLEVFELPASDSISYILQRFTIVNSDNPTMYIRSGTHYINGDVYDIWKAWKKIEATTIS